MKPPMPASFEPGGIIRKENLHVARIDSRQMRSNSRVYLNIPQVIFAAPQLPTFGEFIVCALLFAGGMYAASEILSQPEKSKRRCSDCGSTAHLR